VSSVQDGQFDRNTAMGTQPANYVIVDDGNGWQTIYYHFMANSIAVKVGQTVVPGQVLGLIGSAGDSTGPHLHFQVDHNGDPVETNYDGPDYWVNPFPYANTIPISIGASGITNSNPSSDAEEGPVAVSTFPTSSTGNVYYWFDISRIDPTDVQQVTWYRPDGTVASSGSSSPSSIVRGGYYWWSIGSSTWSKQTGTWHVAISVDGVELNRQSFTVTSGAGVPAARVTQGDTTGTYIVDNRTTPIDFGSAAQGATAPQQTFTVQNVGNATHTLGSLSLPPNFTLVGSSPSSIAPGSTATFTLQMSTGVVGAQFGQVAFATNVPGQSTFGFNIKGTVTGSTSPSAPTVTLPNPAAVYDPRFGPVALDPGATLTDGSASTLNTGSLTVQFASGGTSSDHLAILNQGTGPGQIGTSGGSVLYGGTVIGSYTGGDNLSPLVVTFNAASTPAAAQALAQDILFRTDAAFTYEPRYVRVSLLDGSGQRSNLAVKTAEVSADLPALTTQVSLTGGTNNPAYGQQETLTAAVSSLVSGSVTLTGSVTFEDGGVVLANVPLANGIAAFTTTFPAGTQSLTALYSGDTDDSASIGSLTLSVARAHLTVTADSKSKIQGTANPPLTYTLSGFVNGDTAAVVSGSPTLSTTATTSSPAGTYPIDLGLGTLTAVNYDFPTLVSGTLSVSATGGSVVLVTSGGTAAYGQAVTFTAMVTPGGSSSTPTGTIQFEVDGVNFGSPLMLANGTVTSPALTTLAVGVHAITAVYSGDSNFTVNTGSLSLFVAKAHLTVTAGSASTVYGSPLPAFTATITGFVGSDTAAVVTGSPSLTTTATPYSGAGSYPINVSAGTLAAANYDFVNVVSGVLTVSPAPLTVTANAASGPYGGPIPSFSATITGFVGNDTAAVVSGSPTFSITATTSSSVGAYPLNVAAGTLAAANYTFTTFAGNFYTVTKAHLTVTASAVSSPYGAPIPALTPSLSGFVNGDTASVVTGAANLSTSATSTSGVGVYPITVAAGTLAAANYDFPNLVSGTLTVTKADLTVTANAASSTYGGPIPQLSATFTGFASGDTAAVVSGSPALSTTATSSSAAGSYPISIGIGTLAAANYDFPTLVAGVLTVKPAHLTVTASAASSTYGAPLPAFQESISGFVNGDSAGVVTGAPALTTTATTASAVGMYPINVGVGTLAAANYDFANLVSGTLTITKAHLTVTAGARSSTYGAPIPALGASFGGFVNGDTSTVITGSPALTTTATSSSPVGTYPINVSVGTLAAANYDFPNLVGGTLTITKAHLTVTADNKAKVEGTANPPLTATISGFAGNDTAAVVSGSPTLSTTALTTSPIGTYPITVGVGTLAAANYDFPTLANGVLTVTSPGGAVISLVSSIANPSYGQPLSFNAAVIPGASGAPVPTGMIQFTLNGGSLGSAVTLTGGSATSVSVALPAAGTYTIAAVYSGDNIYTGSSSSISLPVARAHLTVTANTATITYGSPLPALSATFSGLVNGDAPTVVTGNPALSTTATASSGAGAYPISVGVGTLAATNYDFPNLVAGTLTIEPARLVVSAASATSTYGAPLPAFGATISGFVGSDNLGVVTGAAVLTTPASASSGVGTYPIDIGVGTLAAPNYTFSTLISGTLTITKAHLSVKANSATSTYGSPLPGLGATITGYVNGDNASAVTGAPTLTTAATAFSGAGVYPINVGLGTLAAANYEFPTLASSSLTVTKAHLTVTADDKTKSAGTLNPPLTATFSGFLGSDTAAVVAGSPALSTTATTSSPAGTYPITVAAGTLAAPNYDFPNVVSGSLVVTPAGGTTVAVASVGSATYGQALSFSATVTPDLSGGSVPGGTIQFAVDGTNLGAPVALSGGTATSAGVSNLGAGTHTVTATYSGENFYDGNTGSVSVVVARAHLTVTATGLSSTYGAPLPPLVATLSGFVNGDTEAVVSGSARLTTPAAPSSAAGVYPITVSAGTLAAANYDFTNLVGASLNVAKAHLTVAANPASSTYGSPIPPLTVTLSGFVNGDTASVVRGAASVSTTANAVSAAGDYPIHVGAGALAADNYDFTSFVGSTLTIGKAPLTVTAYDASVTYGSALPPLSAVLSGFVNGDGRDVVSGAAGLSTTATSSSPVGTYPIKVSAGTLAAANYNFPNLVDGTFTVTKAHLAVAANRASMTYGGPVPTLGATITGFVSGDTASVISGAPVLSTIATSTSNAGVYPITISLGTLAAANYDFSRPVGGILTVNQAPLTVTAGDATMTYGDSLPTFAATLAGFVNGDTSEAVTGSPALSTTASSTSSAGNYPIAVGQGTLSAANYDFPNLVDGTLTIKKAHLTVTASPASSVYGGPIPALSATISGFVGGDTASVVSGAPDLSTTATPFSGAGVYPITVGPGTLAATNYDFPNLVGSSLTIAKAHLTVTANPASSTFGQPIPSLTATLSGLLGSDTAAVVTGNPALSTTATASSDVGAYPIAVALGTLAAANYDFPDLVGGTLTINPAPAMLSLGGLVATYDGQPHTATLTTDPAGLTGVSVSYTSSGITVPAPLRAGSYVVSAALDNPDYTAAPVSGTLVINPATPTITWADPAPIASGTALGAAQLDARASAAGSFQYSPPAGTVLTSAGPTVLSVSFTPDDTADYRPVGAQVTVNVTPPPVVAFSAAQYAVDENAGAATIVVTRSGDASRAATVTLATGGGSATPGVQYTPVSTAVVFGPGVTTEMVAIPIADNHVHGGDVSVGLSLSASSPTVVIGGISSATLVIHENDAVPAMVQSVQLQKVPAGKHRTGTAIAVQFSGALNSAAAGNLGNYHLVSAGKDKKFGTKDDKPVALAQATYNAAANTVTLTTTKPLVLSPPLQLTIVAPSGDVTASLSKQGISIARRSRNPL
jgi:hypothetical protein